MPIDPLSLENTTSAGETRLPPKAQPSGSGPGFWHELIARVAATAGLDPELVARVAARESGMNPDARNPVSGAIGMMQLMPATAAALGVDPRNPVENVLGGVKY